MAVCSFNDLSVKNCGNIPRNKDTYFVLVPVKSCAKSICAHLRGCLNTSSKDVKDECELILLRAGLFKSESTDEMTICPLHRDHFGLGWRPSRVCKHPMHNCKQKPARGVTRRISLEIFETWGMLCEIGQGIVTWAAFSI